MVSKYSCSETKVGYSAQATSPKVWWEMPKFLKVQTRSSDAEISWIACRHIPHPLILVAFVSVISYFQLPACSADPNEPRSRGRSLGRSVSQVNALSSSLAVISLSNLEMGRVRISYLPSGNCFSPVLYLSPGGHFVQTNNPPKPAKAAAAASPSAIKILLLPRCPR